MELKGNLSIYRPRLFPPIQEGNSDQTGQGTRRHNTPTTGRPICLGSNAEEEIPCYSLHAPQPPVVYSCVCQVYCTLRALWHSKRLHRRQIYPLYLIHLSQEGSVLSLDKYVGPTLIGCRKHIQVAYIGYLDTASTNSQSVSGLHTWLGIMPIPASQLKWIHYTCSTCTFSLLKVSQIIQCFCWGGSVESVLYCSVFYRNTSIDLIFIIIILCEDLQFFLWCVGSDARFKTFGKQTVTFMMHMTYAS